MDQSTAGPRGKPKHLAWRSALAGFCLTAAAHAQEVLWVTQFGTSEYDWARALAPDGAGGAFFAGATGGVFPGDVDTWLARYDTSGHQTWLTKFGTSDDDYAYALGPDGMGGTFIAGHTYGSFGGQNQGKEDAWVARYDASGDQTWIAQLGSSDYDETYAVAPDGAGGTFVAGDTHGDLGGPNEGVWDAWLARYDTSGSQIWIAHLGTSVEDYARALAPDSAGGAFIAGITSGSLGGPKQGQYDAWLARYDASGDQTWITQLGTKDNDEAYALTPDGAGGAFVAGVTWGSLGGSNEGGGDAWFAHYDGAGNQIWITQLGTSAYDDAKALAPDGAGGTFIGGSSQGSLGGPNQGQSDAWLARYDSAGDQVWSAQLGTGAIDDGSALAPDGTGGTYIAGSTEGSLGGPIQGEEDAWLARFRGGFAPACYPDINGDDRLDLFDFLSFVNSFNSQDELADCDGNGTLDLFDFLCFLVAYIQGC